MNGAFPNPRERILAAIVSHPGVHLRELPRLVGFSLRSVRYHLEAMERVELVTAQRSGRFLRFFPNGAYSGYDRTLIAALRVRGQREILRAMLAGGDHGFSQMAESVPISRVSLSRGLRALERSGIVRVDGERRYGLVDPSSVAMRLAFYRQRFPDMLADAAEEIFEDAR